MFSSTEFALTSESTEDWLCFTRCFCYKCVWFFHMNTHSRLTPTLVSFFFHKRACRFVLILCVAGFAQNALAQSPLITAQPASQNVVTGQSNVAFSVVAKGSTPLFFQWKRNGAFIPGATGTSPSSPASNSFLIPGNISSTNAGSYSVVVWNSAGALDSSVAILLVTNIAILPANDKFASAGTLSGFSGTGRSGNVNAGRELGEPDHGGKPGSASVWLKWTPPVSGIATFDTKGSGFDTTLGIYIGNTLSTLVPVAGDDDRGGFFNSAVSFNATNDTTYYIAIDGFYANRGNIVLNWFLEQTRDVLPEIITQPKSATVALNQSVTLTVALDPNKPLVQYQWHFNGQPIFQETRSSYKIDTVTASTVGEYTVLISSGQLIPRNVFSATANIQINVQDGGSNPDVAAERKFQDAFNSTGGNLSASAVAPAGGFTGSQIFNTYAAPKQAGEPNHCDEAGGSSYWYSYRAPANGVLKVDSIGSTFNNVLAVYTGSDFASLVSVACSSTNAGLGNEVVTFSAVSGTTYSIVSDGVGGVTGSLTLNYNLTAITNQPVSKTVSAGTNVTFTVGATGPSPLRYQWRFNTTNILNATNTSLTITNIQSTNDGNYTVVVTNSFAAITSSIATLTVNQSPAITTQPKNQNVTASSNATFTVIATGNPTPTYQWRFGATNLVGATNSSLTITNAQTNNAGTYSVGVTNALGGSVSSNATLTVNVPPSMTLQPLSQTSNIGANVTFTSAATGTAPLSFQWRFGGSPGNIQGATNTSLTVTNVQASSAGNYRVIVTNVAGTVMSAIAILTINTAPTITTQPQSQTVTSNSSPTLTVTATGTPTPSYQWQFSNTNLPGENASTLLLSSFRTNNEGTYRVVVSNSVGTVTSSNATLALNAPMRINTFSFASNIFQMQLIGIIGTNYIFQTSSNLTDWNSLLTNNATNGFIDFSETNLGTSSSRSYRAQQLP